MKVKHDFIPEESYDYIRDMYAKNPDIVSISLFE